jgi:hypothetical protein
VGMVENDRTEKKTKREIIVNAESLETRVAIMEDGHLEEFSIERPTEERIVGSIYKGRIQNMEDGLQAAFVDIGMKKNAFIHYWDMIPEDAARLEAEEGVAANRPRKKKAQPGEMAKLFPPGSEIIVQVTKGPIGTKGPRVTANLSIPGRYLVMMPGSKLKGVSRKIEDGKERERLKKALGRLPIPSSIGMIIRTSAGRLAGHELRARPARAAGYLAEDRGRHQEQARAVLPVPRARPGGARRARLADGGGRPHRDRLARDLRPHQGHDQPDFARREEPGEALRGARCRSSSTSTWSGSWRTPSGARCG